MRNGKKLNAGKSGAVRQEALKPSDLTRAEKHGKREDESSQKRRVRDEAPLVFGTLDLTEARKRHMEGVLQSGRTACIHALVQFPTDLINGADKEQQQRMLDHAVTFLNEFHGGDAVFAARLDRDETGRHTVDVFLLPKYDFRYKDGRVVKKASVSKFSKEQARARYVKTDKKSGKAIINRTTGKPIPRDDTRAQGSALQDAFFEYLREEMQLSEAMPPERKKFTEKDRLEPEEYGLKKDRERLRANARVLANADRVARERNKRQAAENESQARSLARREAELQAGQKALSEWKTAFERSADSRAAALDKQEEKIRRAAKTVRKIRIASGQGVSR
ncbi:hypothetical protein [Rhodovulum sp. FJ3]|uniref:hypothetical protein n=1 Tax=Rhodovulum sp. FJ3 TaxID=3079053 RepID=UPI00293DAF88|nr:hypothetical protein [Rhodovulum sp. FJ3]MDV4167939.1 hypothetical protein [Rhodovulum sp. FJ3]